MPKKIITALILVMVITLTGCSFGGSNQLFTLEGFAQEKNFSVGELNKNYLLDHQYKHKDGTFMSVNLTDIRTEEEIVLTDTTLKHSIVLTSADSFDRTKAALNDALFFELYTSKGRKANLDLRMFMVEGSEGKSEIILNCEKFDMTLYDYLVVGPVEEAPEERLVYAIKSES
ncbi:hypothetical protein Desde_3944 [Desulfitobacterium dehalogenans ATCC 51507]|uniref:Lipoprotein n=1 Tax=Desulfitobacterium dehalogenans (strain ATCC 51507 / DSM 9161 / JW/IU-DC1) TaxID=756499 RepID=I4AE26_DESDJ|nr:hypothetical protein [Desulfitobacterium dehalogenans]AFM02211.1 hypothetical protein Desde_3944 [Desulfitobacterium dehalogenans ATCC 51507]